MSYKVALFAYPKKVDDEAIVKVHADTIDVLSGDVEFGDAFLVVQPIGNVKFGYVVATDRPAHAGVDRGTAMDMHSYERFPYAYLGYDDQNGINLFECGGPKDEYLFLMSDGCLLGGKVEQVKVDFPQKGFSNAELDKLNKLDEDALTPAQYRAIAEYESAIDIGLRDRFSWKAGRDFLKICYAKQGYPLTGKKARVRKLPADAAPLYAFWPSSADFRASGLRERVY